MAITRSQIARQLLAEGGVSLDDAKMMAPPGEFLAYINPKEAGNKIRGLDVTIVTTSKTKEGTLELLKEFNFPLNNKKN